MISRRAVQGQRKRTGGGRKEERERERERAISQAKQITESLDKFVVCG